jgi:hypothetical protein
MHRITRYSYQWAIIPVIAHSRASDGNEANSAYVHKLVELGLVQAHSGRQAGKVVGQGVA